MSLGHGATIVKSGLVVYLDAANLKSYPGTGTVWSDISTAPLIVVSSTAADTSTNSITLSTNNLSYQDDVPSGATGKSIRFNSSDIGIPENASYLISGDFTFEFWGKFDSTQQFWARVFNYRNDTHGGSGDSFEFFAPGGKNSNKTAVDIGGTLILSSVTHNDATWRHYAVVRSGSTITFYVDGTSQGTATNSNSIDFGSSNQDGYGLAWAATLGRDGEPFYPNSDNWMRGNFYQMSLSTTARYTSSFTPSTDLSNDANTLWFIEANSSVSDGSSNGSLVNSPSFSSDNRGVITFDGTNDYVDLSSIPDGFWQDDWTASFWVNFDTLNISTSPSADKTLIQHGTNSTRSGLHLCQRNTRFHFGLFSDDYQSVATLSTGIWYSVTFVMNNSTNNSAIYINGQLDNTNTHSGPYTGTGTNTRLCGTVLPFGNTLDGIMPTCAFYDRVLTQNEITQNFQALRGRYGI